MQNKNMGNQKREIMIERTKITVRRTFGTQDLCDLYSEYVVKKIRESVKGSYSEEAGVANECV